MDMENKIKCIRCGNILTEEEKIYIEKNELQDFCDGYLCKNHWCICMPKSIPWNYLIPCIICNQMICKSCAYQFYISCKSCNHEIHDTGLCCQRCSIVFEYLQYN